MGAIDRPVSSTDRHQIATFAVGCFWSAQVRFQCIRGVLNTQVGFINGHTIDPNFVDVSCGDTTGHALAVQIQFDSTAITYDELLEYFWSIETSYNTDVDIPSPYRSGIYFHNDDQMKLAHASKMKQQDLETTEILTEIEPAGEFYPADDYHQRYLEKGGQCMHPNNVPCSN